MANLIPPDAKKAIITEYWIRVVVVWLVLVGCGLVVVALLKVPTLALVQSQTNAFSGAYDEARVQNDAFRDAELVLLEANDLSELLVSYATTTSLLDVISILDGIAGDEVQINTFKLDKSESAYTTILITGVASTRSSLSNFSKDIEAHELFEEAALPLSSLAKDRDIAFNLNIKPSE